MECFHCVASVKREARQLLYRKWPRLFNIWAALVALMAGSKLHELLSLSDTLPSPNKSRMLLGIFTIAAEAEKRTAIRSMWRHMKGVCTFQGRPVKEVEAAGSSCRVIYTFVLGSPGAARTSRTGRTDYIAGHIEAGDDETYLNIEENMEDGKTPTWFRYAATIADKLKADYVGKMDSDTWLKVDSFIEFLDTDLPPAPVAGIDNRKRYGGVIIEGVACGVSVNQHCKLLRGRAYMAGQFYFVSSDLADYILNEVDTRILHVGYEDFDFGLYILSYPGAVNFVVMSGHVLWVHDNTTKYAHGFKSAHNMMLPRRTMDLVSVDECLTDGLSKCLLTLE